MAHNTMEPTEYRNAERERQQAREEERLRETRPREAREPVDQRLAISADQTGDTLVPVGMRQAAPGAEFTEAQDRTRWGPIWAGLLTTLTSFLILEFLGIGLGLISPANGDAGLMSGISSAIAVLIAFFLGGWVAESASVARGPRAGMLNGFLVWALATTLILALSLLGLSSLFGALGNVAGQFLAAVPTAGGVNASLGSNVTRTAGWVGFISMVISALAATFGGLAASRGHPIGWIRP